MILVAGVGRNRVDEIEALLVVEVEHAFGVGINRSSRLLLGRLIVPHTMSMGGGGLVGVQGIEGLVNRISALADVLRRLREGFRIRTEVVVFTACGLRYDESISGENSGRKRAKERGSGERVSEMGGG